MLLSAILCMSAVACTSTSTVTPVIDTEAQSETEVSEETGNEETDPVLEEKYSSALSLIEEGSYEDAYLALKECKDYKDSEELLKNFKFVYRTRITPMDGGEFVTDSYTYDERGNCIKEATDLYDTYTEWTYGENDKPLTETVYRPDKTINNIYIHNEDGTISKMSEDEDERYLIYTYDSEMKIIKEEYFYAEVDTVNYIYDENGNLIEVSFLYEGNTIYSSKYEYDEYSNKTRYACTNTYGEETFCEEYVNILNDDGKPTQTQLYRNGEYLNSYRYTYDEYGNLIKEEMFDEFEEETDHNYVVVTEYSDYQLFYIGD